MGDSIYTYKPKDAENLIGFPFNWNEMQNEDKNIFLKKYFKGVSVLDGQIQGIMYSDEVQQLMNLHSQEDEELKIS